MSVPSLAALLEANKKTLVLLPSNKIKCTVTQHEMPARADVVNAYLLGAKYQKALKWYNNDFEKYEPHIVADKRDSKKLYCTITGTKLNRIPEEVEKHVNGKRYKRLLAEKLTNEEDKGHDKDNTKVDDEFTKRFAEFVSSKRSKPGNSEGSEEDEEDEDVVSEDEGEDSEEVDEDALLPFFQDSDEEEDNIMSKRNKNSKRSAKRERNEKKRSKGSRSVAAVKSSKKIAVSKSQKKGR